MNQSTRRCHEVEGAPYLLIDAFKTHKPRTSDHRTAFVLTHYHGDHYSGLPRDFKYRGPARIHCTHVTAELLREVHGVAKELVVGHGYGEAWTVPLDASPAAEGGDVDAEGGWDGDNGGGSRKMFPSNNVAEVTFWDANHCPGAAIVFIHLPDGRCHLHTGDMRYQPSMREYRPLREAALGRKLDVLYLDTTYGHPKHDFAAQDEAVETIAAKAEQLLRGGRAVSAGYESDGDETEGNGAAASEGETLILLSCYSIGKEKVLAAVSQRTGMLIYANERKRKMLRCVQIGNAVDASGSTADKSATGNQHENIMDRITEDPSESDVHVVPMGMAGELWPYFRPNYNACAEYAASQSKRYERVVAFLPTGWADGSNWNKKNAVSKRKVDMSKIKRREDLMDEIRMERYVFSGESCDVRKSNEAGNLQFVDVEIRLVPYSEHSTYAELRSLVQFLKPRRVVPTVFSDGKIYTALEKRFNDLVDERRAKLAFFGSMAKRRSGREESKTIVGFDGSNTSAIKLPGHLVEYKQTKASTDSVDAKNDAASGGLSPQSRPEQIEVCLDVATVVKTDISEGNGEETVAVPKYKKHRTAAEFCNGNTTHNDSNTDDNNTDEKISILTRMGFSTDDCRNALEKCDGNVELAVETILSNKSSGGTFVSREEDTIPSPRPLHRLSLTPAVRKEKRVATITHFFSPKQC